MAKLTTAERHSLPRSEFAGPDRSYPVPDRSHAANAKARASQAEHAGRMSKGEERRIDAKADKVLHHGSGAHEAIPGGKQKLGRHHSEHGFVRHSKQGY